MKTIAITIDEASLAAVDRLARTAARRDGRRSNRSQILRQAVCEFLDRHTRAQSERNDGRIFASTRRRIARQAEALVAEQQAEV